MCSLSEHRVTNTDDPDTDWHDLDWANRYREHNRALAVGDVVIVGEQAWAIEWIAWRRVTLDASQIVGAR